MQPSFHSTQLCSGSRILPQFFQCLDKSARGDLQPPNKLCTACGILAIGASLLGGWVVVTTLILPERMLFCRTSFRQNTS